MDVTGIEKLKCKIMPIKNYDKNKNSCLEKNREGLAHSVAWQRNSIHSTGYTCSLLRELRANNLNPLELHFSLS